MRLSIRLLATVGSVVTIMGFTAGHAHASSTYVSVGDSAPSGIPFSGGDFTLNTSAEFLGFLNIHKAAVEAVEPSVVTAEISTLPGQGLTRTAVSLTNAVNGVWVDNSGAITGLSSIGGVTLVTHFADKLSHGGTLSITNLQIDFQSQRVYASITGDFRGVGTAEGYSPDGSYVPTTLNNFHLWSFTSYEGDLSAGIVPAPLSGPFTSAIPPFSLGNLAITQQGFDHVVSALKLYDLGTTTLQSVASYGSITTPVPEPASASLLLVGLLGVAAVTRNRANVKKQAISPL